jgi:c-di-GMP-binding flagellar brake protein YcgR
MSGPRALIGHQRDEVIADAAHQKSILVLTCKVQGRWETHKSRLLDVAPARRALVVAYPQHNQEQPLDFTRGEEIGVAFRYRSSKCLFASTVIGKRQPRRHRSSRPVSKSLLLSWPDQIEQLQRRVYHRVDIPADSPIAVRLWPGGMASCTETPPTDRKIISGSFQDLSVGGARVSIARKDDLALDVNDLVGMEFSVDPDQPILAVEACFRHAEPTGGDTLSLGFQFIGLEVSPERPSLLSRLARAVSRIERMQAPESPRANSRPS